MGTNPMGTNGFRNLAFGLLVMGAVGWLVNHSACAQPAGAEQLAGSDTEATADLDEAEMVPPPSEDLPPVDTAYDGDQQASPAVEASGRGESWRFVFHNGEWWYWMPTQQWVYWRHGKWHRFDAREFIPADVYYSYVPPRPRPSADDFRYGRPGYEYRTYRSYPDRSYSYYGGYDYRRPSYYGVPSYSYRVPSYYRYGGYYGYPYTGYYYGGYGAYGWSPYFYYGRGPMIGSYIGGAIGGTRGARLGAFIGALAD